MTLWPAVCGKRFLDLAEKEYIVQGGDIMVLADMGF